MGKHLGQYHLPLGLATRLMQPKWNHSMGQSGLSHPIISPYETWLKISSTTFKAIVPKSADLFYEKSSSKTVRLFETFAKYFIEWNWDLLAETVGGLVRVDRHVEDFLWNGKKAGGNAGHRGLAQLRRCTALLFLLLFHNRRRHFFLPTLLPRFAGVLESRAGFIDHRRCGFLLSLFLRVDLFSLVFRFRLAESSSLLSHLGFEFCQIRIQSSDVFVDKLVSLNGNGNLWKNEMRHFTKWF